MNDIVVNTEIQVPTHVTLKYDVEVPFVTLVTQADWAETDSTKKGFIRNKPELATVAISGDYTDLANTPTIPVIPTNVSSFTNDAGYITNDVNDLTNYTKTTDLAAVAMSGDYDDLLNKPTIPAAQIQSDWNQTNTSAKDYIKNKPTVLSAFVNDAGFIDNTVSNLVNYPLSSSLATVAQSGSYNDLTDKPTIPTVNDGVTTLQLNGTQIDTFSANQSGNNTINIEAVPTFPAISNLTTLAAGALNELGTIDFSTISLPSTPGTAEYNCRFTDNSASGGDITQNAGLSSVTKWVGDTTIVTGKSYEMSIQNGWGIITQFD